MLLSKPVNVSIAAIAVLLLGLSACADRPNSETLERSFAADPRLNETPVTPISAEPTASERSQEVQSELPADFPETIPRYPNAEFQRAIAPTEQSADAPTGVKTIWETADRPEKVLDFYTLQFQQNNWQIVPQATEGQPTSFSARKGRDLLVTINVEPTDAIAPQNQPQPTEFTIEYIRPDVPPTTLPNELPDRPPENVTPNPVTENGQIVTSATPEETISLDTLEQVPQQLRPYIADMEALGAIDLNAPDAKSDGKTTDKPADLNQPISRRQFAQWLLQVNNKIYANQPGKQIRLAPPTTKPAFQDVPQSDPDFQAIQGLAEAGIIPSPLSGDSSANSFRPDAPLTREQLLLWKVPLDIRSNLPTASVDAIKETWGFQDAAKIDPKALRAVYADYQNGEMSNIRRAFGYTTLFQPKKEVTRAESAAALWYFGQQGEGLSVQEAREMQTDTTP